MTTPEPLSHFHSSTTSGLACLMRSRTRASASRRDRQLRRLAVGSGSESVLVKRVPR
jgi:hypothetical protein